jgi:hypothetical protein
MIPRSPEAARRRRALYALSAVIVAIALAVIFAPARTPAPLRLMAGCGDLMAAAFVLLAASQIAPKK